MFIINNLPLPPSLASQTIKRRLTITLAWFTSISSATQRCRTSRLWFESNNQLVKDWTITDWMAVQSKPLVMGILYYKNIVPTFATKKTWNHANTTVV